MEGNTGGVEKERSREDTARFFMAVFFFFVFFSASTFHWGVQREGVRCFLRKRPKKKNAKSLLAAAGAADCSLVSLPLQASASCRARESTSGEEEEEG